MTILSYVVVAIMFRSWDKWRVKEEDKTDAVSDTSLPSSDLVDLLLSEAKELLAPILSSKDGKH